MGTLPPRTDARVPRLRIHRQHELSRGRFRPRDRAEKPDSMPVRRAPAACGRIRPPQTQTQRFGKSSPVNVYTFFTPIPGKTAEDELALINVWRRSWAKAGWNPVVLGEDDLPDDADARRLKRGFHSQPTQIKPGMEYSWFVRWLAVAHQGGGFMCDYDVINYSFPPREVGDMTVYERHVPCLVSGTSEEFLRICELFATYHADSKDRVGWLKKDTSDMKILIRRPDAYTQRRDCVEFGLPGWETADAVHFSNFAMKPRGFSPRDAHIAGIRPFD